MNKEDVVYISIYTHKQCLLVFQRSTAGALEKPFPAAVTLLEDRTPRWVVLLSQRPGLGSVKDMRVSFSELILGMFMISRNI